MARRTRTTASRTDLLAPAVSGYCSSGIGPKVGLRDAIERAKQRRRTSTAGTKTDGCARPPYGRGTHPAPRRHLPDGTPSVSSTRAVLLAPAVSGYTSSGIGPKVALRDAIERAQQRRRNPQASPQR